MKYSEFTPYIAPEVQGCPDFLIERSVRDAAIEFCQRTDVYIAEPEILIVSGGLNAYDLSAPQGTELNHILDIFEDKRELNPVSYSVLLKNLGNETTRGSPRMYSQRDNTEVYLAPIPSVATKLRVLFSVMPSSNSTGIPNTIGREHREAISHGALYRLQSIAGHTFTNLNLAVSNRSLFERSVGRTIRQVKYGFSGGSLTAKSRAFI